MKNLAPIDYNRLLKLNLPWEVTEVRFDDKSRIDIQIDYTSSLGVCPKCAKSDCKLHDKRPSRSWRHLDTMQYETHLHCNIPRIQCDICDQILSVSVPWSESRNGHTFLFENYAISILLSSRSVEEARKLLRLNWHQLNLIKSRAVSRGLKQRDEVPMLELGIDEKSYAKGHTYASILTDISGGRVLELVEGRRQEDAEKLIKTGLNERQRISVQAVAIDMSKSFQNAIESTLPKAKVVHDIFHISKHLNEAVDKTRRWEHKMLLRDSNKSLQGLRFEFLRNSDTIDPKLYEMFQTLDDSGYHTAKAWHFKELFRCFWKYSSKFWARKFFEKWYKKIIHSNVRHMKKTANMLRKRIENILNYFSHRITNAKAEGFNSKIQTVQSNSRGFRNFQNLRIAVLFYCGKLQLKHHFPL